MLKAFLIFKTFATETFLSNHVFQDCPTYQCPDYQAFSCAVDALVKSSKELISEYTSPCSKKEYESSQLYYELIKELPMMFANYDVKRVAIFAYAFVSPESMTMHEEYFVYGLVGVIGYVGGILGIFVGFSFLDSIASCLKYIKILMNKLKKYITRSPRWVIPKKKMFIKFQRSARRRC